MLQLKKCLKNEGDIMRDFYLEQLVKRKNTKRTAFLKILLVLGTVASIALIVKSIFFIFVPFILLGVTIVFFKITNVEYEYIFFNGDFDIDKIIVKQFRKRIVSTGLYEVEVIAPTGSLEIQQYRKIKKYNYSSRRKGVKTYQMVINHKGKRARIVFEPTEELLTEMKLSAPRKVYF